MGSKLTNPRVHVIMSDGQEWVAQTSNPDLLAYERTAVKHKWPPAQENPVTWLTFLAWSAGRRTGGLDSSVTWEAFSLELCSEVDNAGPEDAEKVDPTSPGAGID